jgi:hypothetical protein
VPGSRFAPKTKTARQLPLTVIVQYRDRQNWRICNGEEAKMKRQAQNPIWLSKRQSEQLVRMETELSRMRLQRSVAHCLLVLFAVNTLSALTMIFLVGAGKMALSESLIQTVIAGTLAQAAPIFVIVTKSLFPRIGTAPNSQGGSTR